MSQATIIEEGYSVEFFDITGIPWLWSLSRPAHCGRLRRPIDQLAAR